jgi:SAM-dependent methyltransferase
VPAASHNYWPDTKCAKAFWSQHTLAPYQQLLADTVAWLDPRPGERWLDLGCGSGHLSRALWRQSGGAVAEVIGLDCAAVNADAYWRLRHAEPTPIPEERVRFVCADFSTGLASWPAGYFDGVVSGLAIQYAESYSEAAGRWTTEAYDRLLSEVGRVLRPGGRFVLSLLVPEPAWGRVVLGSLPGIFRARNPLRFLQRARRMWSYGGWLKREARRGRFHYLPLPDVLTRLSAVGLTACEHRLSYFNQAYLIRCRKAAAAQAA